MKKRELKTMAVTMAEKIYVMNVMLEDTFNERDKAMEVAVSLHKDIQDLRAKLEEAECAISKYENLIGVKDASH